MLEPSFALVKRHEHDQQRAATEYELKLQQQLEELWLRIARLEHHAPRSEADKTTLERLLRDFVQEKLTLMDRVKHLEDSEAQFRHHLDQTESIGPVLDHWPTADSDTLPEMEIISVRSTPSGKDQVERTPALDTADFDSIKLHAMLPSVLFIVDPENTGYLTEWKFLSSCSQRSTHS